jgi:hypothetical protein
MQQKQIFVNIPYRVKVWVFAPQNVWAMEFQRVMGFNWEPPWWTAKTYGLLQIMGYDSYGL